MPSRALRKKPKPVERAEEMPDAAQAEPAAPAEIESADDLDFFARLQSLTAEDWREHKTYVYRTWPVIDRRDSEHFLAKVSEPFDEDYLLRFFGTGKYNLRLNNGQGRTVAQKTVSVHNPDFPPKVSPDEVVQSDPRNERYFQVFAPKATEAATSKAPADVRSARAGGGEVTDAAVRLAIAQSEGRDALAKELAATRATAPATPPNPLGDLKALAEVMKNLQPPIPSGDQRVDLVAILRDELNDVRKQLSEDRAEQRRLQQELFTAKTAAPALGDPVEELAKQVRALTRMREIIPGAEGIPSVTEPSGWLTFFQGPVAAVVVNEVAAPLGLFIRGLAQKFFPTGSPLPPQPGAAAATAPQPGGAAQPQPRDFGVFLDVLTPRMLHFLRDYDDPAATFGEWFHDGYSDAQRAIDTMVSLGGVPALMAWYRTSKHWPALAPIERQFTEFLTNVIAWRPEPDETETASPADATAEPVIDLEAGDPRKTDVP